MAIRSKAWVCGCSFLRIVGSNPAGLHGCLSFVSVVCCQVEVSATGQSLVLCECVLVWEGCGWVCVRVCVGVCACV